MTPLTRKRRQAVARSIRALRDRAAFWGRLGAVGEDETDSETKRMSRRQRYLDLSAAVELQRLAYPERFE